MKDWQKNDYFFWRPDWLPPGRDTRGRFRRGLFFAGFVVLVLTLTIKPAEARKGPFSGSWSSSQYTNGKEFFLKLQQSGHDLIGWEGLLPPNVDQVPPDLQGTVKGKIADIQLQHRRGYQAHARLRLQGDKLVFQLMECDSRSNRYFPLASTLSRRSSESSANLLQIPPGTVGSAQALWGILSRAESFECADNGDPRQASPYFSAYKALLSGKLRTDDFLLQTTLRSGSPAGKLYAAAILFELSQANGQEAFNSLSGDNSPVTFKSGLKIIPTTVSAIARSFSENGSYMDFSCKKY